jgi:hypothetical protein
MDGWMDGSFGKKCFLSTWELVSVLGSSSVLPTKARILRSDSLNLEYSSLMDFVWSLGNTRSIFVWGFFWKMMIHFGLCWKLEISYRD